MRSNETTINVLSDKLQKLKVAIYIRVSTHWQIDKDSLQVQRRELIAYAEMVLGISDYVIFEDAGYSAKNTERPDYQAMMDRLRTGEFSHLLVWKIDRISRNLLDFASMHQELKRIGVVFISKNEQFDTSSAIGEAMLKIILVFAELERNMTSERVTAVMLSRANNGQWNGGHVPYGYKWDKSEGVLSKREDENPVVVKMANLYEQMQSLLSVARHLNDLGYRTRKGKVWTATQIHKILTNPFYIGVYVYNVHKGGRGIDKKNEDEWITIPDHHESTLSVEQFERIAFALRRNGRGGCKKGETHKNKNIHVFAGLVRCGVCGNNMSATLDRRRANGWRPTIYGCSRRRNDSASCLNKYTSDAVIGPFVFNYIANIIRAKGKISKAVSLESLERKLLRGDVFSSVTKIEEEGLSELRELLLSGNTGLEYRPPSVFESSGESVSEREVLEERRRKLDTALHRLKSVYLYGDEDTPVKDFIIERQNIVSQMNDIDARITELNEQGNKTDYGDEFLEKASYFLMLQSLLEDRYVDYEKYIRHIDQGVPAQFVNSILNSIEVADGKVTSITFKNGICHKFIY